MRVCWCWGAPKWLRHGQACVPGQVSVCMRVAGMGRLGVGMRPALWRGAQNCCCAGRLAPVCGLCARQERLCACFSVLAPGLGAVPCLGAPVCVAACAVSWRPGSVAQVRQCCLCAAPVLPGAVCHCCFLSWSSIVLCWPVRCCPVLPGAV